MRLSRNSPRHFPFHTDAFLRQNWRPEHGALPLAAVDPLDPNTASAYRIPMIRSSLDCSLGADSLINCRKNATRRPRSSIETLLFVGLGLASINCAAAELGTNVLMALLKVGLPLEIPYHESVYDGKTMSQWLREEADSGGFMPLPAMRLCDIAATIKWDWKDSKGELYKEAPMMISQIFKTFPESVKQDLLIALCIPGLWEIKDPQVHAWVLALAPGVVLAEHGINGNNLEKLYLDHNADPYIRVALGFRLRHGGDVWRGRQEQVK